MNEKAFKKLFKTIEREAKPFTGVQEKILKEIMISNKNEKPIILSPIERFLFEKPLRAACVLGPVLSGVIWACMGSSYTNILSGFIGIR